MYDSDSISSTTSTDSDEPDVVESSSTPVTPTKVVGSYSAEMTNISANKASKNSQKPKSLLRVNDLIRPKWGRLEYIWEIESFWELRALASIGALGTDASEEEIIWSTPFGNQSLGYWRMKIYPYGDSSSGGRENVSLYLALDSKHHPELSAYAMFGCSVLNIDGSELPGSSRTFTRQRFKPEANSWGWSQFIKDDGHNINRMLVDQSKLIIRCRIDVYTGLQRTPLFSKRQMRTFQEEVVAYASAESDIDVLYGEANDRKTYKGNSFLLQARASKLKDVMQGIKTYSTDNIKEVINDTSHTKSIGSGVEPVRAYNKRVASTEGVLYPMEGDNETHVQPKIPSGPLFAQPEYSVFSFSELGSQRESEAVLSCKGVLQIDPSFSEEAVMALLSEIHIGTNAMVSEDNVYPGESAQTVLELFHLAKEFGCKPLYWRCAQDLSHKMVTEHDAIMIGYYAKQLGCKPLQAHAEDTIRSSFPNNRGELLECMLPHSANRLSVIGRQ